MGVGLLKRLHVLQVKLIYWKVPSTASAVSRLVRFGPLECGRSRKMDVKNGCKVGERRGVFVLRKRSSRPVSADELSGKGTFATCFVSLAAFVWKRRHFEGIFLTQAFSGVNENV